MQDSRTPLQRDAWAASFAVRPRHVEQSAEPLFHYTSACAFEKIISNRELWLSNAAYLNDEEELSYPASLARMVLSEFMLSESDSSTAQFVQEVMHRLQGHILFKSWFVGSLTNRGNQLSQWRAYCPAGGYSIGFSAAALAKHANQSEHLWLRKIIYDREEQTKRLRQSIAIHINLWRTLREYHAEVPQNAYDDELANTLGLALSEEFIFFKRDVFVEEQEWRLAKYRLGHESASFYERRGVLTPYLPNVLAEAEGSLPLHAIIVGPLGDHALAEYSAKLLLQSKGYDAESLLQPAGYRIRT